MGKQEFSYLSEAYNLLFREKKNRKGNISKIRAAVADAINPEFESFIILIES